MNLKEISLADTCPVSVDQKNKSISEKQDTLEGVAKIQSRAILLAPSSFDR